MKPVTQTVTDPKGGNCFAACLASLLELPLAAVPNFCAEHGEDWFVEACRWCWPHGVTLLHTVAFDDDFRTLVRDSRVIHIAGGPSPRGGHLHAAVYEGDQLLHDPYPGGRGLVCVDDMTFLVPLAPRPA